MTPSIAKGKHPLVALLGLMAASLAILPLLPPIPQDPSYHQFADQRTLLGIPNFWNVVSNLPFALVGAMGLWQFGRDRASFVLFLGIFLTGFGSTHYHWDPNDDTLFWELFRGEPLARDGHVTLSGAPGLGLNLNADRVREWKLA